MFLLVLIALSVLYPVAAFYIVLGYVVILATDYLYQTIKEQLIRFKYYFIDLHEHDQ